MTGELLWCDLAECGRMPRENLEAPVCISDYHCYLNCVNFVDRILYRRWFCHITTVVIRHVVAVRHLKVIVWRPPDPACQRPCIISCSIAVSCTVQIMDQSWWAWNTSSQIRSDVVSTWACWKQNRGEMSNRWPWTCLLRGPCQFLSVFLAVFFIYKTLKESNNFICFSIREILNIRVYICICSSLLWELKNPCGCKVEVFWEGIEWFDKWCLINLLIN